MNLEPSRLICPNEASFNANMNPYMRLMANYVFVQTNDNALGIRNGISEQPEIFEMRAQVEF